MTRHRRAARHRAEPPLPQAQELRHHAAQAVDPDPARRIACIASPSSSASLMSVALAATAPALAQSKEPVKIGLSAAVSGGSAASGEAIKRGLQIAIDEINAKGGVLGGRKLELVVRRRRGQSARRASPSRASWWSARRSWPSSAGLHTTVALAQVPVWHELRTPYMGAWAAGTNITRNGQARIRLPRLRQRRLRRPLPVPVPMETMKKSKPGLLLENTPGGSRTRRG